MGVVALKCFSLLFLRRYFVFVLSLAQCQSLDVLQHLGEAFIPPDEISMTDVAGKVKDIQSLLQNVTKDDFKSIPVMTDATKLNAMQIMALLCSYAHMAKAIMLPYLSYRMIELTKQYGMCDDAIVGLAVMGFALISLANDIQLGYNVGKIAEFLAEESPNRHSLRVRISVVWDGNTKLFVEPCQSVFSKIMWVYNSAKLNGDIDTAMVSAMNYCFGMFLTGEKLEKVGSYLVRFLQEMVSYQQSALRCNLRTNESNIVCFFDRNTCHITCLTK